MKLINIVGNRFGRLVVLKYESSRKRKDGVSTRTFWTCQCDCGKEVVVDGSNLRTGHTLSCGCLFQEAITKHGKCPRKHDKRSGAYKSWQKMRDRCLNKNSRAFANYGGRGIKICVQWSRFENFYNDMGERPKGMSIEREDVNGDYCKANCRWASRSTQDRNKRTNRMITYGDKTMCLTDWSSETGIAPSTLRYRVKRWPLERALTNTSSAV